MHSFLAIVVPLCVFLFFLERRLCRCERKKPFCSGLLLMQISGGYSTFFMSPYSMRKISSLVPWFIISLLAFAFSGVAAAIDGAIAVVSSDPGILLVTPTADGKFHVAVVGVGRATLTVSGDADLGDGIRNLSQKFEFEVYDGAIEADHFELQITEFAAANAPAIPDPAATS
jgi:hypothetical protein